MDTSQPLAGLAIMVVEDDRQVAEDVSTGLHWAGAVAVEVAITALQVQQRLTIPPFPDIILLDFYLIGQQTGLDVALWLYAHPELRHIVRVLYTSADMQLIQRQCPDDQVFHAVISKPVPLQSLIEQLVRVVHQQR